MLFLVLFVLPTSFAHDLNNTVDENQAQDFTDEDILSGQEIYFNASAEVDGDGSMQNPYKFFNNQRIGYGNTLIFANGVYNLTRTTSINTATFIGQDAQNTIINLGGHGMSVSNSLTLKNITLYRSSISNDGGVITASNVIFNGGSAKITDKYDGSFGGAISNFASNDYHYYANYPELYLDNCTFLYNNAAYGGAIYIESGKANITNSRFKYNYATNYGGAITIVGSSTVDISNTTFNMDYTLGGEAGAIYTAKSKLTMKNCSIENCFSTIGSGICDLNSNIVIDSLRAYNNNAYYYGGVIYKMYGDISVTNSKFEYNHAKKGGAIYVDNADSFVLKDNQFALNNASSNGGATYSLANNKRSFSNNTYLNSSAGGKNDEFITADYDMQIGSGEYEMYNYVSKYNGTLPERYSLVDDGYVSPISDQQTSGNCWAFASIAALESCILKASNVTYDLSEENLKNLIEYYSDYGWNMMTNEGGYDEMAIAYFTSWLGPVLEVQDKFDDYSLISPVIDGMAHVQNVLYLGRESYTDNDAIKEAILTYGAVVTGMYYDSYNLASNGAYYSSGKGYANHAVTIVGWDDNYSRENFLKTPRGDGAWIVKNSWGESWGDNGYFYASYYDGVLAMVGDPHFSYTFILNDSIKLDKNYQYDISGITDYFITGKDVIWYKNVFNATDDELLTAFSTYFNTTTDWQAYVYVNDELVLTQNGSSVSGYFTIYLNQFIPLHIGDVFSIALRINASEFASFPVSEDQKFTRTLYKKNTSFFSYDGKVWYDLYKYKYTGYDHTYTSQTACIKAFTSVSPLNSTIILRDCNVSVKNPVTLIAEVFNNYGKRINSGVVSFIICNKTYSCNVSNGIANVTVSFDELGEFDIYAFYESDTLINPSNTTAKVTVSKSNLRLSVNASDVLVFDDVIANVTLNAMNNDSVNGTVTLIVNGKRYEVNVLNGFSSFRIPDYLPAGDYELIVVFNETEMYYFQKDSANFTVSNRSVEINLSLEVIDVKNLLINAVLNETINGTFTVLLNGMSFDMNCTEGEGMLLLNNLDYANYTVAAFFSKEGYFTANASGEIELKAIKTWIMASDVEMHYRDGSRFNAALIDESGSVLSNQTLVISLNGVNYTKVTDENGCVSLGLNLNSQNYTVTVNFNGTDIYSSCESSNNVTIISTLISNDVTKYYKNATQYYVTILDKNGNPVAGKDVSMNINGVFYNRTTDESGTAKLNINLPPGEYILTAKNPETGEMVSSTITVLSRIVENSDLVKYYRNSSQYSLKVLDKKGNPASDRTVKFNINGVFYYHSSDENGTVKMNINLSPGKYIITATYDGYSVSNNITVLSTIESHDLDMSYHDGSKFEVHLLDARGFSAPYEEVVFNINGVLYSKISDAGGMAGLKINLMSGEYIITTSYGDLNVANKITIH